MRRILLPCTLFLFLNASVALTQTFQVGPESSAPAKTDAKPAKNSQPKAGQAKADQAKTPAAQAPEQELGWGSNIGNARLARAAQLALQRGDHGLAVEYARRATQSAPNDPQLWFLLGYASRLDSKYGASADAYQRGLKLGSSIDGTSGLAQTYSQMGRTDEAERLFKQVVAADPRRRNDLAALGELYTRAGSNAAALEWLGRAERIEPTAQTELLLAVNYQRMNQLDQASHYLQMAKARAPGNPDIDRSLSAFYRATGDFPKAIAALLEIHNPRPDVLAELAFTYALAGKPEDAARLYTEAANALPRDVNLQLSAAQSQVTIGSIDHATMFLDRAAKLDAHYYRLHAIRGEIAQIQDQVTVAADEYSTAISNLPAAPPEGVLYGIQLHMTLEALYKSLDEPVLADKQLATAKSQISVLDERGTNRPAFLRLRALIKMNGGELDSALTDMAESLALTPNDPNSLQLDGDLLVKMGRTSDAIAMFEKVLAIDPRSRFALTSLGYASRSAGKDQDAEKYFKLLADNYPKSYVPFLALGDLYTAEHTYKSAEANFLTAYKLAPANSIIVAGGMNAAIESHDLTLAGVWQKRVTAKMEGVPQVMREEERFFYFTGDAKRSAEIGRKVIKITPKDRDVVVYLGYDLLHLDEYTELAALTAGYKDLFPKEPDIPLLAGYVYKHDGELDLAVAAFTEALSRDPNIVTAYTNRGFVYNDMSRPELAATDFKEAIKREPRNNEAHMGLAFAELNLHHPQAAIRETELAEAISGDSELIHVIRATAYGREGRLSKATIEYKAALKFDPNDGSLYLGLGNILFAQRRFREAITELDSAEQHLHEDASIYALKARSHASLDERAEALQDIGLAEQYANRLPVAKNKVSDKVTVSDIYIATGQAFNTLGEKTEAMGRFSKALLVPGSNRFSVRLAIAGLMAEQDKPEDAERQIALAQMEVTAGDTIPETGEQLISAANVFQEIHEYPLSETYLERARAAGAPDPAVRISMANGYLALGETRRAAAELQAVKQTDDGELDYQYLLAEAALFQQEHRSTDAQTSFARAASDGGEDQTAERSLMSAGADEGFRVTPRVSLLTNAVVQPIFEDSTVYVLDSKLDSTNGPIPVTASTQLPLPRSSLESDWLTSFHLHYHYLPTNGGFFQIRNARGVISVPATDQVVHRNTTDYALNFGLDPTIHLGDSSVITFNSGVQGTMRRDSLSPVQLNQNLLRGYTYFTTSSFFNAISANGFVSGEFGPFTESSIYEHTLTSSVNFRVGAPWSRTALITGWGMNHQHFNSSQVGNTQNYYTSSYIGVDHRFSERLSAELLMEDVRAWRIVPFSPINSAISQAIRPGATVNFAPRRNLELQFTTTYENTRGFHIYDITQNGFVVSYTRPLDRSFNDKTGRVRLRYPIRFSGGVREETFFNFTNGHSTQLQPYVSLTVF